MTFEPMTGNDNVTGSNTAVTRGSAASDRPSMHDTRGFSAPSISAWPSTTHYFPIATPSQWLGQPPVPNHTWLHTLSSVSWEKKKWVVFFSPSETLLLGSNWKCCQFALILHTSHLSTPIKRPEMNKTLMSVTSNCKTSKVIHWFGVKVEAAVEEVMMDREVF